MVAFIDAHFFGCSCPIKSIYLLSASWRLTTVHVPCANYWNHSGFGKTTIEFCVSLKLCGSGKRAEPMPNRLDASADCTLCTNWLTRPIAAKVLFPILDVGFKPNETFRFLTLAGIHRYQMPKRQCQVTETTNWMMNHCQVCWASL